MGCPQELWMDDINRTTSKGKLRIAQDKNTWTGQLSVEKVEEKERFMMQFLFLPKLPLVTFLFCKENNAHLLFY